MANFISLIQNKYFRIAIGIIAIILVSSLLTYHYTSKHYQDKLDALQYEYNDYKSKYSASVDEREQSIISNAIADNENNTEVVAPIAQSSKAEIVYVEKTSKSDSDVEVTNTTAPVVVSYIGRQETLPTKTTENKEIKDGKVVITQENTTKLDVTDIVNREIANTVTKKDTEIKHLKREKKQDTFLGVVGGILIGAIAF